MRMTVDIRGMHCGACVRRVTEAFQKVPGVTNAEVTLAPPRAHVESDGPITVGSLDAAARSAGSYSVIAAAAAPASPSLAESAPAEPTPAGPVPSLYPLVLIVLYIAGAALLTTYVRGAGGPLTFMLDFMAGFFLVFSFFKLLDLRGFADAYQSYDIVARRARAWAFAYPFIELGLGVAYLVRWQPMLTNAVTLAIMLVGSIGVFRALARKERIRCACLGTALNLPMTTVTLTEDLVMAAMAAAALAWPH